jgi:type IV secretory pathway TraG/TraD family ATPase VirD4
MWIVERLLEALAVGAGVLILSSVALAVVLRRRGLRWTWALLGLPAALLLWQINDLLGLACVGVAGLGSLLGASWHYSDLAHGADYAEAAHRRIGILQVLRRTSENKTVRRTGSWVNGGWLRLGCDERGMPFSIPVGYESGCHTLVLGATGAGKTVSEAWIACRMIEAGHGAIVIDPKGDPMLHSQLKAAARTRHAAFLEWTPEGPLAYNPYAHGSGGEIADKALAGERFTEPHYQRQAQRYLAHAVRVMHAAEIPVTPVSLLAHMDPAELEVTARRLPEEQAAQVQAYLDSLSERQQRELSGVRDRLAILAESEVHPWLEPGPDSGALDLQQAVQERAVVYFRLDSDRRLLLSEMLAGAIVIDLVTLVGRLQRQPTPTVVMIDEFSAVAAEQVSRLFGRARSAGISLILGTQELADLGSAGDGALREQVLANITTLIAHRQNVPESAELIASIAATKPVWVSTQQTEDGLLAPGPSGRGSRRRGYEFEIHPSRIKRLATGWAVVVTPGAEQAPGVVRVNYLREGRE